MERPDVAATHPDLLPIGRSSSLEELNAFPWDKAPPERPGQARRERIRVPRTPPGMEDSRLPHRRRKAAHPAGAVGHGGDRPMNDLRLLEDKDIDSALLREATEKLNFIWGLAITYRAPGLLVWLDNLTGSLVSRQDFVKSRLKSRRAGAVA